MYFTALYGYGIYTTGITVRGDNFAMYVGIEGNLVA